MSAGIFERRRRDVEAARQRAGTDPQQSVRQRAGATWQTQRGRASAEEIYRSRRADVEAARKRETE